MTAIMYRCGEHGGSNILQRTPDPRDACWGSEDDPLGLPCSWEVTTVRHPERAGYGCMDCGSDNHTAGHRICPENGSSSAGDS